jgi:cellulose synthase/poly-beta-1,6-N-acetylglucosamine synthase-like glycosyltransferase
VTLAIAFFYLFYASRLYLYSYISLTHYRQFVDPPPGEEAWVTVLLPIYNEPPPILNRLLKACTSFHSNRYDVTIADDSTNPETLSTLEEWKKHEKIRIVHRTHRDGFKGAALLNAIENLEPRTTHLLVFDADFLPDPDVLASLLTSFEDDHIAAVQGHQSHSLNAAQNWLTKAVHASSAAGFTMELSARSRLNSFIQLGGTIMMIRRDVLGRVGGFTPHLAEEFDLTLRFYLAGYKVLYREDVSVPGECPSRLVHVVRQNLRWSQGITSALTQHFQEILNSPRLTRLEKLDLFVFGTFHLQALLFLAMSIITFASLFWSHSPSIHTIFSATPIALYLGLSAPASTAAGLYRDNALRRSCWIPHALLLAYLLLPFQAYGAVRGLLFHMGAWHRTPKTGIITEGFEAKRHEIDL